jgi:hypothetical protein
MNTDDWLTVKAACDLTGYADQYLRRLLREKAVDAQKFGHVWMVSRHSLMTYYNTAQQEKDKRYRPKPSE